MTSSNKKRNNKQATESMELAQIAFDVPRTQINKQNQGSSKMGQNNQFPSRFLCFKGLIELEGKEIVGKIVENHQLLIDAKHPIG